MTFFRLQSKGQALVEFALMSMLLFTFLAFIVNVSYAYRLKHVAEAAARNAAEVVTMRGGWRPLAAQRSGICVTDNCLECNDTICATANSECCIAVQRAKQELLMGMGPVIGPTILLDPATQIRARYEDRVEDSETTHVFLHVMIDVVARDLLLVPDWNIFAEAVGYSYTQENSETAADTGTFTVTDTWTGTGTGTDTNS